jgi:hypothetical protein
MPTASEPNYNTQLSAFQALLGQILFSIQAPYRRKTNKNPFFALLDNL